jgi:hypothetical protein
MCYINSAALHSEQLLPIVHTIRTGFDNAMSVGRHSDDVSSQLSNSTKHFDHMHRSPFLQSHTALKMGGIILSVKDDISLTSLRQMLFVSDLRCSHERKYLLQKSSADDYRKLATIFRGES